MCLIFMFFLFSFFCFGVSHALAYANKSGQRYAFFHNSERGSARKGRFLAFFNT